MKKHYFLYAIALIFSLISLGFQIQAQKPSIYFEPAQLSASVYPGDSIVVHTVLHNGSIDTVEFNFPGYTAKDQGGPDDFGYSWIDSEEDGGPAWEWSDISETGTLVEGLLDDQPVGPFEMGFAFPFYGQFKNHFWISPNGVISFDEQMVPFVNEPIPTNDNYIDFIAWFWDDLIMDSAISRVYIKHFEEKTVVQFTKMVHYPGTESFITGQVVMMVNGSILIKYRLISEDFEKTSATVGLQSWNSQQGLQVVYNAEYVHSELAVRFDLVRNFITDVTPASLTLLPGTQETIWLTYSSAGYGVGGYEQDLKCTTSHPELPYLMLHNVMHVLNPEQSGFKGYVTSAATGYAINDVKVQAGEQFVYTNNNGYYELPLEQGSYSVHFIKEGYQSRIVEDTTAMPGYSVLDVTMEPIYSYFLVGRVFAGENYLETGFAYAYKMVDGTVVDVYAEMVGEEGWYEFTGLAPADYIVKAEPSINSQYYGDFLPTYYGDVLHWEEATVIHLTENTDGAQIHLVPAISSPTGPGSISGTVSDAGRSAEVPVILRNPVSGAVQLAMTGADGYYSFGNLEYGTYEIFAEIPGKTTNPRSVELSEASPAVDNVDMMVTENAIVFLGIAESAIFSHLPFIYPNPVREIMYVSVDLKKNSLVTMEIMDAAGRIIYIENQNISGHKIIPVDVSILSAGLYLMKMNAAGEDQVIRFMK